MGPIPPRSRRGASSRGPARRLAVAALLALTCAGACDRGEAPRKAAPPAKPDPGDPLRPPAERGAIPADAHVVDYRLRATLDEETHRIEGHAEIHWTNRGPAAVSSMPFHLYLNGFRADDTAWMTQGRLAGRTRGQHPDGAWGYIDVKSVRRRADTDPAAPGGEGLGKGEDAAASVALSFAERDEPSLMDVTLDRPVAPGGSVTLELEFVTQLPHVFARSGYSGDFHLVAQWFPKPGVLDASGRWQAHPFTFHSEFFADFGDYEVQLDVPSTMVVGATGVRVDELVEGGRRTVDYRAQMVHDFAWTAGPDLQEIVDVHDGVQIRQLIHPDTVSDAPAHLLATTQTLDSMQARFGPYPWSTLTVVHPPPHARGAGGMEYPTLFTTSDRVRPFPGSQALGFREEFTGLFTTRHELGHQWFQGLLASNEFAQPWLDEGMNTMSNMLVMFDAFEGTPGGDIIAGEDAAAVWVANQPLSTGDALRLGQLWTGRAPEIVDQSAAAFDPITGGYSPVVYRRTAAAMLTLRALTGRDAFDRALAAYAAAWRFRHPTGADLEDALVDELGRRVALTEPDEDGAVVSVRVREFLEQALRTTKEIDFRVRRIENVPVATDPAAGWHRDEEGALADGGLPPRLERDRTGDIEREGVVVVERRGDFIVPVTIEVRTKSGETHRRVWSGRSPTVTWRIEGEPVESVVIDPDGDLYLEARRNDNVALAIGSRPERGAADAVGDLTEAATLAVLGGMSW